MADLPHTNESPLSSPRGSEQSTPVVQNENRQINPQQITGSNNNNDNNDMNKNVGSNESNIPPAGVVVKKMFKVHLPGKEGFVTLNYGTDVTLQTTLEYLRKKRKLPEDIYCFRYLQSSVSAPNLRPEMSVGDLESNELQLVGEKSTNMVLEKSAFLNVETQSTLFKWKRRWCVLKNNRLHQHQKQYNPTLGTIELDALEPEDITAISHKKRRHVFQIKTPKETFVFQAENEEQLQEWVEVLSRSIVNFRSIKRGPVSLEDFTLLHVIGKGNFGKVLQVRDVHTGKIYAMKVLDKRAVLANDEIEQALTERAILEKLVHPFLVNLYFSFQTKNNLHFVMDYINGGELLTHMQQEELMSPDRVRFYLAEIVLALEYLHACGVCYRDLKPENVLLNHDGHVVLTDFGLSKPGMRGEDARCMTMCGTPDYIAPEIVRTEYSDIGYNKAVDCWALGCLLFEMLIGITPFYAPEIEDTFSNIEKATLRIPDHIDDVTADLLRQLLEKDPNRRATIPLVKTHPYFRSINWNKVLQKQVVPPFIPNVIGQLDVSCIDPDFLSEIPNTNVDVDYDPNELTSERLATADQHFKDFAYFEAPTENT